MMKYYYLIGLFFFLSSCSFIDCYSDLEGKYINTRDSKSINYLLINKNGTYFHYYKKDTLEFSCRGKWKKSDDVKCGIHLYDWENYNELGSNFEQYGSYFLKIDGDYLNNGLDGEIPSSFKKEDLSQE